MARAITQHKTMSPYSSQGLWGDFHHVWVLPLGIREELLWAVQSAKKWDKWTGWEPPRSHKAREKGAHGVHRVGCPARPSSWQLCACQQDSCTAPGVHGRGEASLCAPHWVLLPSFTPAQQSPGGSSLPPWCLTELQPRAVLVSPTFLQGKRIFFLLGTREFYAELTE